MHKRGKAGNEVKFVAISTTIMLKINLAKSDRHDSFTCTYRYTNNHYDILYIIIYSILESVAIDLSWDLIARFADCNLPREFFDDWVKVAEDEARVSIYRSFRLHRSAVNFDRKFILFVSRCETNYIIITSITVCC